MRALDPIVIVVSNPEADEPRYHFRPAARWPARSIGVGVTVLVHLLLASPLVLGVAAHKKQPQTNDGPGSVAWASKGEQSESMILLDLSALSASADEDLLEPDIHSDGIQPDELKLELVSLEPTPPQNAPIDEADLAETANEAAGDPTGNAALFGRYMGQVGARIDRAWMRPRSALEGGTFECRARIAQDKSGNVLSIQLEGCGADETWRRSLTSAILRASPLSAPPEPWLFADVITLSFNAEQFVAGQTPEYLYEPAPQRVAMVPLDNRPPAAQSEDLSQGDLELNISGTQIQWAKKKSSVTTTR